MGRPKNTAKSKPVMENELVRELLNLLKANHLPAEKELLTVVDQVCIMESRLTDMVKELTTLREELAEAQRQNHPVKTALQKAVIVLQNQVLDLRDKLTGLKHEIISGCKSALDAVHDKGLSALRDIMGFFKLRPALEAMRENIDDSIKQDNKSIATIEAVSTSYHEAGRHIANMGRAVSGKEALTEAKPVGKIAKALTAPIRADKACLVAMGKGVSKAISAVERLEKAERRLPVMETVEKCSKQAEQERRDMPVRVRPRPVTNHER